MYLDDDSKDSFYTLVMYFNSLRELGGALVLLEDDVPRYLDSLPLPEEQTPRRLNQKQELTSQLNQQQLSEILDRLDVGIDKDPDNPPVDVVLSSNMISVGVDIDRLNAMIVNGQPKNTAEYIQASSRVGRQPDSAGIVFSMYNWTRPRDRSHYERFKAFHMAFYRHVESTSVTPYASRARDRALPAVIISMARQSIATLSGNTSGGAILDAAVREKVESLVDHIVTRCASVDPTEAEDTEEHLQSFIDHWAKSASEIINTGRENVLWQLPWKEKEKLKKDRAVLEQYELLQSPDEYVKDNRIKVPMSMRDVEPSTNIQLRSKRSYD